MKARIISEDRALRYRAVETPPSGTREIDMAGAGVVLGSATPSLESYTKALSGEYALFRITSRARVGSVLARRCAGL